MKVFHEPPGVVGADGDGCHVKGAILVANLGENVGVGRVSREPGPVVGTDDRKRSPESLVSVEQTSTAVVV